MKKLQEKRLRLNRETVLRLERMMPVRGAAGLEVGIVETTKPVTSPLCVSTCCGGVCATE
jgi:hypothetical protein